MIKDLGTGVGFLLRGFRLVLGSGSMLVKGALPVLVSSVVLFGAIVGLALTVSDVVAWATPFADDWGWREVFRTAVSVSLVVAAVAVSVLLFSGITLALGGPFYEAIAEQVEDTVLGGAPGVDVGWARTAWIGLRDSVAMIGLALLFGVPLFALGFVPVLGQTVVPVLAALVGGWLLAVELTGIPFVRRGMGLGARRRALAGRRAMAIGFGLPVYLLCLIPLAALVVFPAAMAGGTLLAHRVSGFTEPRTT